MAIYSKEQLLRASIEAREDAKNRAQAVQKFVSTLAATMLTLLFPVGYVVKLSKHGRILIFLAALLLCACLLVAVGCNLYFLRMEYSRRKAIKGFLDNYEKYSQQLSLKGQLRRLTVGKCWPLTVCANLSFVLFVLAIFVLLALLLQILFPSYFEYLLNYC